MTQCHVARLRLYNFRNYENTELEFDPGLNIVAGHNAQGKTNLVEAIACLSTTRSPRASAAIEELRWGSDEAALDGTVMREAGPVELGMRLARDGGTGRITRTFRIDGKPRHGRDVLGICPIVLFSPDDLQLVKAGPEGRRRRLDMLLSQADKRMATELLRYKRVTEQRNALLRRAQTEGLDLAALKGFTTELVRYGSRIRAERVRLTEALSPRLELALANISGGDEVGELRYAGATGHDAETAAEELRAQLNAHRELELIRGVTLAGPHRDDVEIVVNSRPAKSSASQGQQRSLVLALVLAEVQHLRELTGLSPVVLLDDVLSELDGDRRAHLLSTLSTAGAGQVFVTTCDPPDELGLTGNRISVTDGHAYSMVSRSPAPR